MKKLITLILALMLVITASLSLTACNNKENSSSSPSGQNTGKPAATAEINVRVITVNVAAPLMFEKSYIKYPGQTPDDYTIAMRANRLCALVEYFSPDILMLQEVNGRGIWWDYLITREDSLINRFPKYGYVGTTNLSGGTDGAGGQGAFYNQLYYNKNKFELIAGGTFFCRDDKTAPENQFTGDFEGTYNMSNTTTCSWAVLRDKDTNVTAVYGTTHLCTRPDGAQAFRNYGQARNLTEGLYEKAEQYKWGDDPLPIVVGGDFNGSPTSGNFFSYEHMTENAHYRDCKVAAPNVDDSGTARIFGSHTTTNGSRIDYIFQQGAAVTDYKVLDGTFIEDSSHTTCEYNTEPVLDGTQFDLTDHLPVYAKLKITGVGYSEAPEDYVNREYLDDEILTENMGINATATKIIFDSPEILQFVGNNERKGFEAHIVDDGVSDLPCLRLSMPKSRIDPIISIDYGALMKHLGLDPVSANKCSKIKMEYRFVSTHSVSSLPMGASASGMIPVKINVNTAEIPENDGWITKTLDFSGIDDKDIFWTGNFNYFGITSGVGLMAGDGIYIRYIELIA